MRLNGKLNITPSIMPVIINSGLFWIDPELNQLTTLVFQAYLKLCPPQVLAARSRVSPFKGYVYPVGDFDLFPFSILFHHASIINASSTILSAVPSRTMRGEKRRTRYPCNTARLYFSKSAS